jgi:hypothetical protein
VYDSGWGLVAGSSEYHNKSLISLSFEALPAEGRINQIKMFKLNQPNIKTNIFGTLPLVRVLLMDFRQA